MIRKLLAPVALALLLLVSPYARGQIEIPQDLRQDLARILVLTATEGPPLMALKEARAKVRSFESRLVYYAYTETDAGELRTHFSELESYFMRLEELAKAVHIEAEHHRKYAHLYNSERLGLLRQEVRWINRALALMGTASSGLDRYLGELGSRFHLRLRTEPSPPRTSSRGARLLESPIDPARKESVDSKTQNFMRRFLESLKEAFRRTLRRVR